ncbi:MAG: InlB B-repeat-containing protein [Bacteroidales bacterium]
MKKSKLIIALILFAGITSAQVQPPEIHELLRKGKENYTERDHIQDLVPIKSADDYDNVIYIDPDYTGSSDGTIEQPYQSFPDPLQANTAYLLKRGSTYMVTNEIKLENDNILIGAYGEGDRPIVDASNYSDLRTFTFESDYGTIRDLNIRNARQAISSNYFNPGNEDRAAYNMIYNNILYRTAMASWSTYLRIIDNEFYFAGQDAIFLQNCDYVEFSGNIVYHPNRSWHDYTGSGYCPESQCHGDALQFHRVNNWYVHNNYFDRSDTGNKFSFIANEAGEDADNYFEYNIVAGPHCEGDGGAGIYIGSQPGRFYVQYNHFIGPSCGAVYTHADVVFRNNILEGEFANEPFNSKGETYDNEKVSYTTELPEYTEDTTDPGNYIEFVEGEQVTLEAVPATGWEFSHWEGDVTGSDNPLTITMDADTDVIAVFVESQTGEVYYSLYVATKGQGEIEIN